jgi:hypothetical protein
MRANQNNAPTTLAEYLRQHVALVATAGISGIAAFVLLIVARGDLTTALALLRYSSPAQVLLGTILAFLPVFLVLPFFIFLVHRTKSLEQETKPSRGCRADVVTVILLLIPAVVFVPLGLTAFFQIAIVWIAVSYLLRRQRSTGEVALVTFIATIALSLFGGYRSVWLPLESVVTRSGEGITGYVLKDDANYIVLRQDDRVVVEVDADEVVARRLCASDTGRSLYARVTGQQQAYERCGRIIGSGGFSSEPPADYSPILEPLPLSKDDRGAVGSEVIHDCTAVPRQLQTGEVAWHFVLPLSARASDPRPPNVFNRLKINFETAGDVYIFDFNEFGPPSAAHAYVFTRSDDTLLTGEAHVSRRQRVSGQLDETEFRLRDTCASTSLPGATTTSG